MITSILLLALTSVLLKGTTNAITSPSMIAQYDYGIKGDVAHSNANFVDLLMSKHETTVKPFAKLMTKLAHLDKSVCDIDAEVRLLAVSRSLEGSAVGQPQTAQTLESIKSLYAIRKAICETGIASIDLPAPCNELLPINTHDMSQRVMVRSELDLAGSNVIASCLHKFQERHYLWTSYSNNRQDAGEIVQLLRSDVEMHSMIMTYRDFEKSMSGLHEDLSQMRRHTNTWFDEASQQAEDLNDRQSAAFRNLDEGFVNTSTIIMQGLETLGMAISNHQIALSKLSSTASEGLSDVATETSVVAHGIENMKIAIADMFSTAALELTALTKAQTDSFDELSSIISQESVAIGSVIQGLERELVEIQHYTGQVTELQAQALERTYLQHDLSRHILDQQRESASLTEKLHNVLEQVSLESENLSNIFNMIGYISTMSQNYNYFLVSVLGYIALSVSLAPFEGFILPSKLVSNIKTGYCAIQASIYLAHQLNLPTIYHQVKQSVDKVLQAQPTLKSLFWLVCVVTIAGLVTAVMRFVRAKCKSDKPEDIEQAANPRPEKARLDRGICDSQRKRLDSVPRNVRHGTAPPGL